MTYKSHIPAVMLVRDPRYPISSMSGSINDPKMARDFFVPLLKDKEQECFLVACLNGAHHISAFSEVTRGTVDASLVHAREVFRYAIAENAVAIIVAHNHPSGNVTPSQADDLVTRELVTSGKILGIPVLDHIIVGSNGDTLSYATTGRL